MKKRIILASIIIFILLIVIGIGYFLSLATFPGEVTKTSYEPVTEGVKSTFRKGVIYRYPGMPPLLKVSGSHYEMGLQYGVLLRPEILKALESYEKILKWQAVKMGIPYQVLAAVAKYKAREIASRLPKRFLDEFRGIAEGAGIASDAVMTVSMFYDVGESLGCTGVLMRGVNGTIIHGRNQDATSFGGEEIAKMTVVVKYCPEGYNTVTQLDWPLFMGIETGYNDKGLAFSEETLRIQNPNPGGFSIIYLARIALEECSSIDELYPLFDKYPVIGAYGTVWSDRDTGRGIVAELTAAGWAAKKLTESILWNFNHIYDEKLKKHQRPRVNIAGSNWDRERIASAFPKRSAYTVHDAVSFLRGRLSPDGDDYTWYGSRRSICNNYGQQMMVFHPAGDGVYLALGISFAARRKVYHIHDDFSQPPELFMGEIPLRPVVEDVARAENMLIPREEKLNRYVMLAGKYSEDANMQFLVAFESFHQKRMDLFAEYAEKALSMKPDMTEYRLYAGMAAYQKGKSGKAVEMLQGIENLYPYQEIYRLAVLERALKKKNPERTAKIHNRMKKILSSYGAQEYFEARMIPLINALEPE
jgi:predicted choloylglycine hydrolase